MRPHNHTKYLAQVIAAIAITAALAGQIVAQTPGGTTISNQASATYSDGTNSYSTISEAGLFGISGDGNLFKPGTLTGSKPLLTQYGAGTYAYNTDRNNLAPSAGFAWQPPSQDRGFGRLIFGSHGGDSVIPGGFGMAG